MPRSSLFTRFVEIGRVVLVNYGPDYGKLAVIVDVIDHNRALIDGPSSVTGVKRQVINFRRLSLTDLKVKIPRGARLHKVAQEFNKAKVLEQWAKTSWAKRIESRTTRQNLTDFDRFKVMLARKRRSYILRGEYNKLRKESAAKRKALRHGDKSAKKAGEKKPVKKAAEAKKATGAKKAPKK